MQGLLSVTWFWGLYDDEPRLQAMYPVDDVRSLSNGWYRGMRQAVQERLGLPAEFEFLGRCKPGTVWPMMSPLAMAGIAQYLSVVVMAVGRIAEYARLLGGRFHTRGASARDWGQFGEWCAGRISAGSTTQWERVPKPKGKCIVSNKFYYLYFCNFILCDAEGDGVVELRRGDRRPWLAVARAGAAAAVMPPLSELPQVAQEEPDEGSRPGGSGTRRRRRSTDGAPAEEPAAPDARGKGRARPRPESSDEEDA